MKGKLVSIYPCNNNAEAKAVFFFKSPLLPWPRGDTTAQRRILKEAFKMEKGWQVPKMLEFVDLATDFYMDSCSQVHVSQWSQGRVALVGDAAYGASPASGQGTSLALVGAYILAGELKKAGVKNHRVAFASYEEKMTPFVQACQSLGRDIAEEILIDSGFKLWSFKIMMKFPSLLKFFIKGDGEKSAKTIDSAANAITLEGYFTQEMDGM